MAGTLIVSLDFELFWGMLDVCPLDEYRSHVEGGRKAIPRLLDLFERYDIHATWATVGFQFGRDRAEVARFAPPETMRPGYENPALDPYGALETISPADADCFFAPDLVDQIAAAPNQEMACHTFCHYYCREKGQTAQQFEADLCAAQAIAKAHGCTLKSLVLPRNECRQDYTPILRKLGFTSFRDEENDWIHRRVHFFPLLRALRLLDVYLPLTGQGGYTPRKEDGVWNLTGSRAFKTIRPALRPFEGLKMRRIKAQMLHAAKHNQTFHLWFHPHNIGVDTQAHLDELEELFRYFDSLRREYGMVSLNMGEAAEMLEREEQL